jgi:NAD(P)-dependent dehydrogenase (short-subunit alcohol dehydrogenase family)
MSRVLVTGGASGLGAALVRQFLAEGHQVLSTDVAAEGPEDGASYRQLDVRSPGDWAAAV